MVTLALVYLFVGAGISQYKRWARIVQLLFAILAIMLSLPIIALSGMAGEAFFIIAPVIFLIWFLLPIVEIIILIITRKEYNKNINQIFVGKESKLTKVRK